MRDNHSTSRPTLIAPDYVLLTHNHSHSADVETLAQLFHLNPDLRIACPPSCCPLLARAGVPDSRVESLTAGQHYQFPSFVVHAIPATHTEDSVGYVIEFDEQDAGPAEVSLYFTGHTGYDSGIVRAVGDFGPDIVIVPISGQEGNLDCEDAARLVAAIAPVEVIPSEWAPDADRADEVSRFQSFLANGLTSGEIVTTIAMRENTCHLYCPNQAAPGRHGHKKERAARARAARLSHQHKDGQRAPSGAVVARMAGMRGG